MDLQPNLVGERLQLTPLQPNDLEALYAVASDPLLWEQHPEPNRYERTVFCRFFEKALASRGALLARIRPPGMDFGHWSQQGRMGEVIGCSRYYNYRPEKNEVTIGYSFIARSAWGSGINREFKKLMLDHAFRFVENVGFDIATNNYRSIRAVEKLGAKRLGILPADGPIEKVRYQISKGSSYDLVGV